MTQAPLTALRFQVTAPSSWSRARAGLPAADKTHARPASVVAAYCCTRIGHALIFLTVLYALLLLLTLWATPFPPCVTIFRDCHCSCQVTDPRYPDQSSVYHPAAPGRLELDGWFMNEHSASYRTLRPYVDGYASLCGACPVTADGQAWPKCSRAAAAQDAPSASEGTNLTRDLSCYRQKCVDAVSTFLKSDTHKTTHYVHARTLGGRLCELQSGINNHPDCHIDVLSKTAGHNWPQNCD